VSSRFTALGVLLVLLLTLLLTCGGVSDAAAHASLVRTEPADGAVVKEPPAVLKLTFNEPVSPLVFRLIDPNGEVSNVGVAAENATVTLTPARLGRGTHLLSWRVISADGHPVGGALTFSVVAPTARPTAGAPHGEMAVRIALWTAKVAVYIGLFVGIGGAFFRTWIADPATSTPRGWIMAALALGFVAVVYSVTFQGLDALDLPFMDALDPRTWEAGLSTSYGATAVAAAIALLCGAASLALRGHGARVLSLTAMGGAAFALALSGHAATAPPRLLTSPSVFLHVLCVAFWIGALVPLIASVRHADHAAFERFSRVIPYPLGLIAITGGALALIQLAHVDALWTTNYGLVLSTKLAAVLVLLALAAANRYWLTPRLLVRDATAVRPLTWSIGMELGVALSILGLVALWRFTPPPRVLVSVAPVSIHFHGERAMAQIEIEPARAGGAEVTVQVLDGAFQPLPVEEVTLAFSNPTAGIEPIRRTAVAAGDLNWRIGDLRIPIAGRWRLRVEILLDAFDKVVLEDDVTLPQLP
jgi:copper transport protein